jgi:hypothetical protein
MRTFVLKNIVPKRQKEQNTEDHAKNPFFPYVTNVLNVAKFHRNKISQKEKKHALLDIVVIFMAQIEHTLICENSK